MGYAEAIEQQARLAAFWQTQGGLLRADDIRQQELAAGHAAPSARDLAHALWHELTQGDPYFVEPAICDLLVGAAPSFPDVRMTREAVPALAGFCWFARPLPLPAMPHHVTSDTAVEAYPLRAFSWELLETRAADAPQLPWLDLAKLNGVSVGFYLDIAAGKPPVLMSTIVWDFGSSWGTAWQPKGASAPTVPEGLSAMRRYALQFFTFIQQRLLAVRRQEVRNRGARRRLAKLLPAEPAVHVVELRRRAYQQRDESCGQGAEWSCQWLVRGHWHAYHTREGLQPRWVAPYVKGDPSKPLRIAKQTAYAVVR